MQKHAAVWLGISLLAGGSLGAQEKAAQPAAASAAEQKKLLSPENFLELRTVQDPQFSPDGQRVAFVVSEPLKSEKRIRHIWMFDKKSGAAHQFTYSEKSETTPRWSPDGKRIASGSRDNTIHIWDAAVGQHFLTYTGHPYGITALAWSPDG